jgi:hypothetical protein
MGHAGCELADGGHLLGLDELLPGVLQAAVELGELRVALEQLFLGRSRRAMSCSRLALACCNCWCGGPPWLQVGMHLRSSSVSAFFRSVMSCRVSMAPMTSPRALRSGAAVK